MTLHPGIARLRKRYDGPIIDADVHHNWPTDEVIHTYLPEGRQEYINGTLHGMPMYVIGDFSHPHDFRREETYGADGTKPASDYAMLREQLLDPFDLDAVVLSYDEILFGLSGIRNPYFAAEMARASNDYTLAEWIPKDPRLQASIIVSNHVPEWAGDEIRRLGDNPRVCQVITAGTSLDKPWGHPVHDPIFRAAAEVGLPVSIHIGNFGGANPVMTAGGGVALYAEMHPLWSQSIQTHLVSLIMHGTFEKYPTLKVALMEAGAGWVPGMLWRLDNDFKALRREVPWLKRLPSEYFHDHIRITTQPLDYAASREDVIGAYRMFGAEDILMYSSDYPHWDGDQPDFVASRLPSEWLPKIFHENARDYFRLPSRSSAGAAVSAAVEA
jgi:uncharacterized protein